MRKKACLLWIFVIHPFNSGKEPCCFSDTLSEAHHTIIQKCTSVAIQKGVAITFIGKKNYNVITSLLVMTGGGGCGEGGCGWLGGGATCLLGPCTGASDEGGQLSSAGFLLSQVWRNPVKQYRLSYRNTEKQLFTNHNFPPPLSPST